VPPASETVSSTVNPVKFSRDVEKSCEPHQRSEPMTDAKNNVVDPTTLILPYEFKRPFYIQYVI